MKKALRYSIVIFLGVFIADAIENFNLATCMWQIGYEKTLDWHMVWQRWWFSETHIGRMV